MKIYKRLSADYTVTSNEIFRHKLSLKAIGLYLYIVNKPDDWSFSLEGVASQTKDGIDSVRTAVKELKEIGFLTISRQRVDGGLMGESIWIVSDRPLENPTEILEPALENPTLDNPTLEKPRLEKPLQVNTKEQVSNKEVKTNAPQGGFVSSKLSTGRHLAGSRLRVPSANPKKKYSSIKDITERDFRDIALRYHVPVGLVKLNYEALVNYCESKGRRYVNYKSALRNFVLKDARTKVERRQDDPKRGVDFTNLE